MKLFTLVDGMHFNFRSMLHLSILSYGQHCLVFFSTESPLALTPTTRVFSSGKEVLSASIFLWLGTWVVKDFCLFVFVLFFSPIYTLRFYFKQFYEWNYSPLLDRRGSRNTWHLFEFVMCQALSFMHRPTGLPLSLWGSATIFHILYMRKIRWKRYIASSQVTLQW